VIRVIYMEQLGWDDSYWVYLLMGAFFLSVFLVFVQVLFCDSYLQFLEAVWLAENDLPPPAEKPLRGTI
jgi:hypothetical protein